MQSEREAFTLWNVKCGIYCYRLRWKLWPHAMKLDFTMAEDDFLLLFRRPGQPIAQGRIRCFVRITAKFAYNIVVCLKKLTAKWLPRFWDEMGFTNGIHFARLMNGKRVKTQCSPCSHQFFVSKPF
ncbi:hypothetical protein Plhal304r1_c015g0054831 [Plasmopara halstedii]